MNDSERFELKRFKQEYRRILKFLEIEADALSLELHNAVDGKLYTHSFFFEKIDNLNREAHRLEEIFNKIEELKN